ncbi:MAG: AMP-binding protein, partial [Promethearchaeota archaeon]
MEIQLTPEEEDYLERADQFVEKRTKNPYESYGILVEQLAKSIPTNKAVMYEDSSWTWYEFNEESNKIANFFLKGGNKKGNIVAIMMENSPEYLFITTGINKIQGVTSQINVNQRAQALIHAFKISEPKWIIVDGSSLPAFMDIFTNLKFDKKKVFVINNPEQIAHGFLDFHSKVESSSADNPSTTFQSHLSDDAMYIFTSGTTGLPKAAIQNNLRLVNAFGYLAFKLTKDDVVYSALPLYHSLATVVGWGGILQCGSAFAIRKRFSASQFWKDIKKFGATCFLYIGEIPRYLLNRPESEYVENTTLKKMLGVGLRKDVWEEFKLRFKIEHVLEFYGATEGAGGLFNIGEKPGMIGRITVPGAIMIVKCDEVTNELFKDENGFLIPCKPGETGMMLAVILENEYFQGYKDKVKTNKRVITNAFVEGDMYFNTGDLVNLHEDRWVSFADRSGDTFRWKGENVSTLEVESILNTFLPVEMCTVYGVEIPN